MSLVQFPAHAMITSLCLLLGYPCLIIDAFINYSDRLDYFMYKLLMFIYVIVNITFYIINI